MADFEYHALRAMAATITDKIPEVMDAWAVRRGMRWKACPGGVVLWPGKTTRKRPAVIMVSREYPEMASYVQYNGTSYVGVYEAGVINVVAG